MESKHERRPDGGGALHGLGGDARATYRDGHGGAIDELTILRTFGPALTKRLRLDGSLAAYDHARHFAVREVAVGSLDDLVAAFDRLSRDPRVAAAFSALNDLIDDAPVVDDVSAYFQTLLRTFVGDLRNETAELVRDRRRLKKKAAARSGKARS